GDGEILPFASDSFDLIVIRQGLQFMNLLKTTNEIYRICNSVGQVVIVQLTAYSPVDSPEAFEIQRFRNPVRQNFFLEEDLNALLKKNGWRNIRTFPYYSYESVNEWITKAAIPADRQEQIRRLYENSSPDFRRIHEIKFVDGDIIDKMKMTIAVGDKK
ncbi:MAG: methyltransferase domain-containing protein, partial [Planctomycetota bacterium]